MLYNRTEHSQGFSICFIIKNPLNYPSITFNFQNKLYFQSEQQCRQHAIYSRKVLYIKPVRIPFRRIQIISWVYKTRVRLDVLCRSFFFEGGGGEMRGFTYKGLSTCLVGAHIAVMFYHSFHDSGIGISSRSDRPVGLLRTKA